MAADFIVGLSLRMFFPSEAAFWLGSILIVFDLFVSGVVLFIGTTASEEFMRKIISMSDKKVVIGYKKRIAWMIVGLLLTIFGSLLLVNQLVQFISNCPNLVC